MKKNKVVRRACAILFLLFTFAYLYFLQGEVLALEQHVFSDGVTSYSLLLGAIIIPIVLLLVEWLTAYLAKLPARFHAWSYLPSMALLAFICDIDAETLRQSDWHRWLWLAPLCAAVLVGLTGLFRELGREESDRPADRSKRASVLASNFCILFVLILVAASIPRTTAAYLYELKTERLVAEGRYEDALRVGQRSRETTRRLTELRMYALSQTDSLPERIFCYPQDYGEEGLLCVGDTSNHFYRIDAEDVCLSLGGMCGSNVRSTARYLQLLGKVLSLRYDSLAQVDTTGMADSLRQRQVLVLRNIYRQRCRTLDYELCRLLLRKDLADFSRELPRYRALHADTLCGTGTENVRIPKAYREALVLVDSTLADTATLSSYRRYRSLCDTITDATARNNYAHRRYGDTYWWYHDFHE